jgi:hypothetical protein
VARVGENRPCFFPEGKSCVIHSYFLV